MRTAEWTAPRSPAERSAYLAFAAVECVPVGLAFLKALVEARPNDAFDPTFGDVFALSGTYWGFWFGALALPVSLAWLFVATTTDGRQPRVVEVVRVAAVECALVAFFGLIAKLLGPGPKGAYALHWPDLIAFGKAAFWCSVIAGPLMSFGGPKLRRSLSGRDGS